MPHPSQRKGARAELEVQAWLRDNIGVSARRALGAGRQDDIGDITGVPNTVIQVADWRDLDRCVREKLPELEREMENKKVWESLNVSSPFGALFCRRRGGHYVVVMTPDMFAHLWREAQ